MRWICQNAPFYDAVPFVSNEGGVLSLVSKAYGILMGRKQILDSFKWRKFCKSVLTVSLKLLKLKLSKVKQIEHVPKVAAMIHMSCCVKLKNCIENTNVRMNDIRIVTEVRYLFSCRCVWSGRFFSYKKIFGISRMYL